MGELANPVLLMPLKYHGPRRMEEAPSHGSDTSLCNVYGRLLAHGVVVWASNRATNRATPPVSRDTTRRSWSSTLLRKMATRRTVSALVASSMPTRVAVSFIMIVAAT